MFSHQVVYDSFATPWTVAQQVPLSIGFPRQEYWSGLPFSSPRDLPDPGIELTFLALAGGFFITEPPGKSIQFSSVQSLSRVRHFATPWTAARQASLSITNSQSLPKLITIELVMASNHLILCCPLLLLPSVFPHIRVISNESALHTRWPKYWSFSFKISPSSEHPGLISFRMDWLDLLERHGRSLGIKT